jgi:hypothetical protein
MGFFVASLGDYGRVVARIDARPAAIFICGTSSHGLWRIPAGNKSLETTVSGSATRMWLRPDLQLV